MSPENAVGKVWEELFFMLDCETFGGGSRLGLEDRTCQTKAEKKEELGANVNIS